MTILTKGDFNQANSESLQVGVEQLHFLLENMDGVIFQTEVDKDGTVRLTYASQRLFEVMKRDPEEVGVDGRNAFNVVFPDDLERLLDAIREAGRTGKELNRAFRVYYSDKKVEWRHVHGVVLPDQGDGIARMIHLINDINTQKQEKEEMQEKERILDFAMRNTDINIWYFNCDTKECLQGENCQKAHGMPGDALMHNFPENLIEIGYVREDSIEILRQAYKHLWETGENVEFDAWFRKSDHSGWWCERNMLTAITGPDGKVIQGVGIGKNMTTEKELEEKYRSFQNYRRLAGQGTIASFRINLTTGWFGDCVTDDDAAHRIYGSIDTAEVFLDTICRGITTKEDIDRCKAALSRGRLLEAFGEGNASQNIEFRYRRDGGYVVWLRTAVEMIRNPATNEVEALLYISDIDYEKNIAYLMDRMLDVDYEFLGLIDVSTGRLLVFGKNRDVTGMARSGELYNKEMARVFRKLIVGEYYDEGIRTMDLAHVIEKLNTNQYYTCSFPAVAFANTQAGRKQWKFGYLDSSNAQIFVTRCDITDVYTAEYDPLTGLYNRQAFYRHARETLDANPAEQFILIRCDIDRFKAYNDAYGSQAGDRLLAGFGKAVHQRIWPDTAVFSRIEGDHFCILFPKDQMDENVWEALRVDWMNGAVPGYHVHGSVGVYEIVDPKIDVSLMCDRALLALRAIKGSFMGKIHWYDERMREKLMEEQALADETERALMEGQFVLYFQPQVHYDDGTLVGAEVLVRWNHPKRGLILPGAFIPIFEKNGYILKLDAYVWEKSCEFLRRRLDGGDPFAKVPLSVNISRCDLSDPGLCKTIDSLVKKYALPPSLLRLEITESAYMEDPEQLVDTINELRQLGFTVEMDDFGTGYSSLTMLKDVPVDVLKLDMSFLAKLESDRRGELILSAIVRLAESLGLPVIAEGVETMAQADHLISIGCSNMQGYYFGRPMPENEFNRLFGSGRWSPERV